MKVDGTNSNALLAHMKHKPAGTEQEPAAADTLIASAVETGETQEKTPGVIRLLQEGHFKGVADVRLRINFAEELAALEGQNLKSQAESGFETFNSSLEGTIETLQASGELTEDQQAAMGTFLDQLHEVQGTFLESSPPSVENLMNDLQTQFDQLLELLNPAPAEPVPEEPATIEELVAEPEPEMPVETPPAQEPAEIQEAPAVEEGQETGDVQSTEDAGETQPETAAAEQPVENEPITDPFTSLRDSFQSAMETLQANLAQTDGLPEISEPAGNGKAFDKFMAIYESIKNGNVETPAIIDEMEVAS